jgi:riboflavin kinase/FMN adenylyltransferase
MELIRGTQNLQRFEQGCVLSIGNFDGVHLGHQAVLQQVMEKAHQLRIPSVVMTFEPQPLELFAKAQAPARLTCFREKYQQLNKIGLDHWLCITFNSHFAQRTADAFIAQLLVKTLNVKFLVVGDDFRFGAGREGNFSLLQAAGKRFGFEVVSTQSFCVSAERVSSTAIRQALACDDLMLAEALLGRSYSLLGRVSHGRKLGRTLGFPTANVPLKRTVSPVSGVYAVEVRGIMPTPIFGVANIGSRPTVGGTEPQLEVHLFNFQADLYGRSIEVILRHKLRNEIKFESIEALKAQIELDSDAAQTWLTEYCPISPK